MVGAVSAGIANGIEGRTAIMAVVGGTVSEVTGGKFANGAVTAAFVHLYNAEGVNFLVKAFNGISKTISWQNSAKKMDYGLQLLKIKEEGLANFDMHLVGKDWTDPNYMTIYQRRQDYDMAMDLIIKEYVTTGKIISSPLDRLHK